jgi:hypothetical protein
VAEPRMFTENEHLAVLSDRVATETSELTAKNADLLAEIANLKIERDTAEASRLAAETARDTVASDFETFKSDSSSAAAIAAVKDERKAAVTKLTAEDFVTAERADEYAAMEQAAFDAFISTLTAAVEAAGKVTQPTGTPTENASFGGGAPAAPVTPGTKTNVAGQFLAMSR